jgi:molybdate transport system ATP-binding protein
MNTFLKVDIKKRSDSFHLDASLCFPNGISSIFGPSGSGKTTLLNCIAGLMRPNQGEITLDGKILFSSNQKINLPPEKRSLGYMFQDSLLFPHLSVLENIQYGYKATSPRKRKIEMPDLIDLLQLSPLLERSPSSLSGGEKRRVALARALSTSPGMLLLDEPLSSLHASLRGQIMRYLRTISSNLSIPMIYVSHSISEIIAIADQVLVLNNGETVAFDEPYKILGTKDFESLGYEESLENLFDVTITERCENNRTVMGQIGEVLLALPEFPAEIGETVSISLKASDIILAAEKPRGISARNIFRARIESLQSLGSRVLVQTYNSRMWLSEVTIDAVNDLRLRKGSSVYMVVKTNSLIPLG